MFYIAIIISIYMPDIITSMKTRIILAIVAIMTAVGAAGLVTTVGLSTSAHAEKCHPSHCSGLSFHIGAIIKFHNHNHPK
jgi:hypothetical protein